MSWFKRKASHEQQIPAKQLREPAPTPENKLLFQAFEWHTASTPPPSGETHSRDSHWSRLARVLPRLAELGVTSIWIPPGCKANSPWGNGYDCYDLWDLGEFDQKGARNTRWGSREELRDLLEVASRCGTDGVDVIWDAVLNHKTAGDATEETWAVEVDKEDRRIEICAPKKIEAWLRYDFPGRERAGMKYSSMKWRAEHFNGTDWDQRAEKHAIYKLIDDSATQPIPDQEQLPSPSKPSSRFYQFARFAGSQSRRRVEPPVPVWRRPGKGWHEDVDLTYGNFDWLIFSNVYYQHSDVRQDVLRWGEWMVHNTGVHGFRLDAAQHISWNFMREWIAAVTLSGRQKFGRDPFIVGEVLAAEVSRQVRWLDAVTPPGSPSLAYAFDAPLLYSFSRVSEDVRKGSKSADLRTLLTGPGPPDRRALMAVRPAQAVTFVTNHDTQTGQSSFVPMNARLKALFYAFILLRGEGYPCVFWGDLYGTHGDKNRDPEEPACQIPFDELFSPIDGPLGRARGRGARSVLPSLMLARKFFAYGSQIDYLDDMTCVGWTRVGTHDRPGCAVVMSIRPQGKRAVKKMLVGLPGEKWINILDDKERKGQVFIDNKGFGVFPCMGMSVSVYVGQDCPSASHFPVDFDHSIYQQ